MRLFIAIDFNELNDYFLDVQKSLPTSAKLGFTNSFHLTLKFLGEVDKNKVSSIIESLKKIKFEKFSVYLDSLGVFPDEKYIRVL